MGYTKKQRINVLKKVRDLIAPRGYWTKGAYARKVGNHDCYCLVGAVGEVTGSWYEGIGPVVVQDLAVGLPPTSLGSNYPQDTVVCWNDDDKRDKRQVLRHIDKTIARLEAK